MALVGVYDLKRELFPGRPLPLSRAWRWVQRKVFSRGRQGQAVSTGGVLKMSGALGAAVVHQTPARPETFAPSEAWIRFLLNRLDNIEESRARDQRRVDEALRRLEHRVSTETQSL